MCHHVRALALDGDVVACPDLVGDGALGHQIRLADVAQRRAGMVAQPADVLARVAVVVGVTSAQGKGEKKEKKKKTFKRTYSKTFFPAPLV